jgi:competence protein ComEC
VLRSGSLRLDVLWPPRERLGSGPPGAPNELSLVLLARWREHRMLLAGDAEAEFAAVDPGDIDVLKVAHHGSDDPGLEALLARTDPELAVISVGVENTYGHPTATTLAALDAASVPVIRTDSASTVALTASRGSWAVAEP